MFDEWKHHRELKRRIASLKERQAEYRTKTEGVFPEPEQVKLSIRLKSAQIVLDDLETSQLMRKAYKWAVEIPRTDGWWQDSDYTNAFYLTAIGKVGVNKLIREEMRKSIEWWVTVIIVPALSTLIGLLGLLVALVAVSRK